MESENALPCPDTPLLPAQVSECIVHRPENVSDVKLRASFSDVEMEENCVQGESRDIARVNNSAKENTEDDSKVKKDTEELKQNGEKKRVGPDGGWAWAVLLGSFVVMTLVSAVGPCFSLVFSRLLLSLGSSSTTVAWIFNTFSLVWNVEGPLVGPLTAEFGHRPVAMVGSILTAIAIMASAFVTSAWSLFLCFSLVGGVGAGLVVTTSVLIIPLYFTRRLGRANGILMAGTSVGQFVAPHLITHLQEEYTFMGATFILGAIVLNTCVAVATFHPVEWHTRHSGRHVAGSHRQKTSVHEPAPISQAKCDTSVRLLEITPQPGSQQQELSEEGTSSSRLRRINGLLVRVARSTGRDLCILMSPPALIIGVSSTLVINGYLNFIMMVPFMVQAAGHPLQASAWCVSVSGMCNLLTRVVVSALTDCSCFNMFACFVVSIFAIAASSLAFTFVTEMTWLMVIMGVWGCSVGVFMGLYNLVMIQYMGVHNLPSMFGAACLLNGLGFISLGPLLGVVRDVTGSYAISIWILSGTEFLCVILWLFMPAAVAREERGRASRRASRSNHTTD